MFCLLLPGDEFSYEMLESSYPLALEADVRRCWHECQPDPSFLTLCLLQQSLGKELSVLSEFNILKLVRLRMLCAAASS